MQQDSEEVMLASEQWFLCCGEDDATWRHGKLIDLIGCALKTNSADVLRKAPKVVKRCLKAGKYVFNDCELKYRPNWNKERIGLYIGSVTGQSRKERKQLEQDMKTDEFWEWMDCCH